MKDSCDGCSRFTVSRVQTSSLNFFWNFFWPPELDSNKEMHTRFLMYSSGIGCRDVGRPSIVSRRRHSLVQHGMSITEQVIKSRSSLFRTKLDIAPVLIDNEKDVRFKSVLSHDSFILTNPSGLLCVLMEGSSFLELLKCFKGSTSFLGDTKTWGHWICLSGGLLTCCGSKH